MNSPAPTRRIAAPYLPATSSLYLLLVGIPLTCFSGALLTDLAYRANPDMQWSNFSAWLLAFGLAFALVAAIVGGIARFRHRAERRTLADTLLAVTVVVILVLALINNLVHSRDTWQSVVPTGLTLSVLTVIAMVVALVLFLLGTRTRTHGDAA